MNRLAVLLVTALPAFVRAAEPPPPPALDPFYDPGAPVQVEPRRPAPPPLDPGARPPAERPPGIPSKDKKGSMLGEGATGVGGIPAGAELVMGGRKMRIVGKVGDRVLVYVPAAKTYIYIDPANFRVSKLELDRILRGESNAR